MTSLSRHQSRVWVDKVSGIIMQLKWFPLSTALVFLTNMSEKHRPVSPNAVPVKNWLKTIGIEKKLDIISWLKKGEWIVDICHHIRFAYSSKHTICDNGDRITEISKTVTECLCSKTTTVLPEWTVPKTMDKSHLHFYCIQNKYIYCIEICVHCIYNKFILWRATSPLVV